MFYGETWNRPQRKRRLATHVVSATAVLRGFRPLYVLSTSAKITVIFGGPDRRATALPAASSTRTASHRTVEQGVQARCRLPA